MDDENSAALAALLALLCFLCVMCLFPDFSHYRTDGVGSNVFRSGPSVTIRSWCCRFSCFKQLLCAVLQRFICENALSQAAVKGDIVSVGLNMAEILEMGFSLLCIVSV